MEAIKINKLTKFYIQKRKKIKAIDNISFSVKKGEIFGFLGPNGAGKSTTIKIMMGLIKPTSGDVYINDVYFTKPESRVKLGFLPENPNFLDTITGRDFLFFSAKINGLNKVLAKKRVSKLLEEFSLKDAASKAIRKYSKGMLQKICFAASIIHDPDILILDEPLSGLDPMGRYHFKQVFKKFREMGKTIFFSSHILPDVEDLCNRVAIIKKGKVIDILDLEKIKYLTVYGYEIMFKDLLELYKDTEVVKENIKKIKVDKQNLWSTLEDLKTKNVEIVSINPLKKDLENLFVEIIR